MVILLFHLNLNIHLLISLNFSCHRHAHIRPLFASNLPSLPRSENNSADICPIIHPMSCPLRRCEHVCRLFYIHRILNASAVDCGMRAGIVIHFLNKWTFFFTYLPCAWTDWYSWPPLAVRGRDAYTGSL
jgi:hypothetical protein